MTEHKFKAGDLAVVKLGRENTEVFHTAYGGHVFKSELSPVAPSITPEEQRLLTTAILWGYHDGEYQQRELREAFAAYRATLTLSDPVGVLLEYLKSKTSMHPDMVVNGLIEAVKDAQK
jgi:hypothetical protein